MVLPPESAPANAARRAFRAEKNIVSPASPLCRPGPLLVLLSFLHWTFLLLSRWLFPRAFVWLWLMCQIFLLLLASPRLPAKCSPAGPFCIALSCPAGMPAASHRACAALAAPFPRPSQNRNGCKCRMCEPCFESATHRTPSQDSPRLAIASETLKPCRFYKGKTFRGMIEPR